MQVDSKGALGFTRGSATVNLDEVEGGTRMRYHADLSIGGKVAGVGQRLLDQVAKMMTKQGLDALNKELEARLAAGTSPGMRLRMRSTFGDALPGVRRGPVLLGEIAGAGDTRRGRPMHASDAAPFGTRARLAGAHGAGSVIIVLAVRGRMVARSCGGGRERDTPTHQRHRG